MSFRHHSAPLDKFSSVHLQRPQLSMGVSNATFKLIESQVIITYACVGPEMNLYVTETRIPCYPLLIPFPGLQCGLALDFSLYFIFSPLKMSLHAFWLGYIF